MSRGPLCAMFRRLSTTSHSSPDPPGWTQLLYGSHPTIMQRIEMTYAWERAKAPTLRRCAGRSQRGITGRC